MTTSQNCRLSFTFANGTRTHHTFTPQCNKETFAKDVQAVLIAREKMGKNPAIVKRSMGLPTHRRIVGLSIIIEGIDASHALTGLEYSGKRFTENIPSIISEIFDLANAVLDGIGEPSIEIAKGKIHLPKADTSELKKLIDIEEPNNGRKLVNVYNGPDRDGFQSAYQPI